MVVVRENGEDVEKEIPMTVCGYYRNPLENVKNIYAEVYTDESFIETYNPELSAKRDIIYVKLNNLEFFRFGHDKEEKMDEVMELPGEETRFEYRCYCPRFYHCSYDYVLRIFFHL